MAGIVWLVGAGPGDPKLLTLRGRECIEGAEVVVYDRLVSPVLLQHAPQDAELIYVGKAVGREAMTQVEINALLLKFSLRGKKVCRLKGGDPFVFGRGGEEAEVLADGGVPFEIVPGVTSVTAAPAGAGIPVTDRRIASSFAAVTGHGMDDADKVQWDALATAVDTIVVLMGVENFIKIAGAIIDGGRSPDTPAAVVHWGATPRQKTLTGTLGTIAEKVHSVGLNAPAVFVVGDVVNLREKLHWIEEKPLFGTRVLVTRAESRAEDLAGKLEAAGAEAVRLPLIKTVPPENPKPLDDAVDRACRGGCDWIIFTSVNGVKAFFDRMRVNGWDARRLSGVKCCAIGPATADALEAHGIIVDVMPERYLGEGVVESFSNIDLSGKRVLLPRALGSRKLIVEELRVQGAEVQEVIAYRTIPNSDLPSDVLEAVLAEPPDIVAFTSPSTVRAFVELFGREQANLLMAKATIVCIGPVTEVAVDEQGWVPSIVSAVHTVDGMVEKILEWVGRLR